MSRTTSKNYISIKSVWRGEQSLAFNYWMAGQLIATFIGLYQIILIERGLINRPEDFFGEVIIWKFVQIMHLVFMTGAVWRSAGNYNLKVSNRDQNKLWGYVARAVIVVVWPLTFMQVRNWMIFYEII